MCLENLNADLSNVSTWMSANKLTLNNNKTEFMVIGGIAEHLAKLNRNPQSVLEV